MVRKSSRKNAGLLPARYRDDDTSSSPDEQLEEEYYEVTSSTMPSTAPNSSPRQRNCRGRGRPPSRDKLNVVDELTEQHRMTVTYPAAAFPTKDFPRPLKAVDKELDEGRKRDSLDVKRPSNRLLPHETPPLGQRWNKVVGGFLYEGRYIDLHGNTMHLLADYYNNQAAQYEAERHDSQGDAKDKNEAFRKFLESQEAQQAQQLGVKGSVMAAFEKWWAAGGDQVPSTNDQIQKEGQGKSGIKGKDFKDEKFAALHFKLQWCIIVEVEEDLTRYPPAHIPADAGTGSYRYARNLLGIKSSLVVHALERKMEEAKNKEELMPKRKDYVQAKDYLKERWLPLSLIELYDYLD